MGYALPTSSPSCVEGMVQSQRFHQNLVNLGKQIVPNLNLEHDSISSMITKGECRKSRRQMTIEANDKSTLLELMMPADQFS